MTWRNKKKKWYKLEPCTWVYEFQNSVPLFQKAFLWQLAERSDNPLSHWSEGLMSLPANSLSKLSSMKTFHIQFTTCYLYWSCTHSKEITDAWGQWMQFIHLGSVPGSAELGPCLWPTGPLRQGWSRLCRLPPPQAHWCRSPLSVPPNRAVDFPHSQWIHPKSNKQVN